MAVLVRKLEKEDIEQIIPLRIALQKVDNLGDLGNEESALIERTKEFLEENLNKDLFMFGTYVDEELVSICGLTVLKHFPTVGDLNCKGGYITCVYTKEEYRQKGYQKKVFEECLKYGKKLGIIRYKLSTKNPVAMKMYASFGFKEDSNAKKMKMEE